MAADPRRWFQFSLRTMFIAATLITVVISLAVWLAANASLVRQRREALKSPPSTWSYRTAKLSMQSRIPWIRRIIGDEFIEVVLLGTWASEEEVERATQLFPEATVMRNDPFWDRLLW